MVGPLTFQRWKSLSAEARLSRPVRLACPQRLLELVGFKNSLGGDSLFSLTLTTMLLIFYHFV